MKIKSVALEGIFEIENTVFKDERGKFIKTFHADVFQSKGLDTNFQESYYSVSKKNVLRGMHFQTPPYDHAKLVYVVKGAILDVVVDIRKDSETYGVYHSVNLSEDNAKAVYISKGFAHGFLTLSDEAIVVYSTTTVHNPAADSGVRWDSFGFDWGVDEPIISNRDLLNVPMYL